MDLQNKVAWIAGGTRMGDAIADALSQKGCRVVLTYRRSKKAAHASVQKLRAKGYDAIALRCDLTDKKQIQTAAREIIRKFKSLDVLVNLSSIYEKASVGNVPEAAKAWDAHLSANAKGAYDLSVVLAPFLMLGDGGRVVHISDWTSASGRPRYKDYSAYYISKAAIKATVEVLALEFAPKILVNAIAPGPILPPPDLSVTEYDNVVKATPLARWGGADEIAKAVMFLVQTDFVTGETIRVDGGRHLN
jgi:NAD(P)-dependent dehydrogenase (short-subunit alcohol dehydrogenase family)